jgi:hypothetical protein
MSQYDGDHVPQAPAPAVRVPAFVKLPGKYKLPGHTIYPATSSNSTAEAEFARYSGGPLSPHGTDLVDFWNASLFFCSVSLILINY